MQQRPVIPNGEEIYNSIMREIDPELTTDQIPLLKARYKDATEEENKIREQRYQKSYAAYDKAYATFIKNLKKEVDAYKKQAMKSAENDSRKEEAGILRKLEQAFS